MSEVGRRFSPSDATDRLVMLVLAGILLLAALLYRPWQSTPFPIGDWGGNLLAPLGGQPSFGSRYAALMEEYTREGRFQPATMARLAATWSIVGANTVSWLVLRFAVMCGVAWATYVLLRRLGCVPLAAAAAPLLLVVSGMAQQGWLLPQLAEPEGALLLVLAAIVATRYQATSRWLSSAVAIAVLLVVMTWTKETFIIAAPFVLLIATTVAGPGRFVRPAPSRRNLGLAGMVSACMLVFNVTPIVRTRAAAEGAAYAARYAAGSLSADQFENVIATMFLPVTRVLWFPANVVFLTILIAGVVAAARSPVRPRTLWLLVGASALPLAGAVLYAPWPVAEGYYGLAYLPGLMLAFAVALTALARFASRAVRILVVVGCGIVALQGAVVAQGYAASYRAAREVEAEVSGLIGRSRGARELLVGVPAPEAAGHFGAALRRYALASGVEQIPPARDITCEEVAEVSAAKHASVIVVFVPWCPAAMYEHVPPGYVVRRAYLTRDWKTLRSRRNEVSAHVWGTDAPDGASGASATW